MTIRTSPDAIVIFLMLLAAIAALTVAWVAQFSFELLPCRLCLYQRIPYIAITALASLSLMPTVDSKSRRFAVQIGTLLFAISSGVAAFHVGVEQGWLTSSCAPNGVQNFSVDKMMSALQKPGQPACNEVPLSLYGISMAGYNMIYALFCSVLTLWASCNSSFWKNG